MNHNEGMKNREDPRSQDDTAEKERRIREAALDDTIEASFPASDPPSTDPNPDNPDACDESRRPPKDKPEERA